MENNNLFLLKKLVLDDGRKSAVSEGRSITGRMRVLTDECVESAKLTDDGIVPEWENANGFPKLGSPILVESHSEFIRTSFIENIETYCHESITVLDGLIDKISQAYELIPDDILVKTHTSIYLIRKMKV